MAGIQTGKPFGLDAEIVKQIDWDLALRRIHHDLRSDFIYAPHLSFVYRKAGTALTDALTKELKSGTFSPGIPLTLEVPKPFCIRVASPSTRLGPNYSRPGSILLPRDRLLYQALADQAAPIIKAKNNAKRSFSHLLAAPNSPSMFLATRTCWNKLQKALSKYSEAASVRYILKIDVANFFGSINQHTLVNVLNDAGYNKTLSSRLEAMLVRYTGERSSRGILQGMFPSDLFGNFYLAPIDRALKEYGVRSARYVDDMYVFVKSVDHADRLLQMLIPMLRSYDLVLNEAKSIIMPKAALVTEEPDLEELFSNAVEEVSEQLDQEDFAVDYGFQSEWNDEEVDQEELELKATMLLFDSLDEYPGHEESIERYCLPLFTATGSDYAVAHVLESFKKRPAMSQIYVAYLAKFLAVSEVRSFLLKALKRRSFVDWQKMWVLAALLQASKSSDQAVKNALDLLNDANRHDALRAVAAVYVGRFGDHGRRKELIAKYQSVTNYVQAAIYYVSRHWPSVERSNAKATWSGHGSLHSLLTSASDVT